MTTKPKKSRWYDGTAQSLPRRRRDCLTNWRRADATRRSRSGMVIPTLTGPMLACGRRPLCLRLRAGSSPPLEWTRQLQRVQELEDVLNWDQALPEGTPAAIGLPTIQTELSEPSPRRLTSTRSTRFPAFSGEFVVKPAVSSGVRDIGAYTTVDVRSVERHAPGAGLAGRGRSACSSASKIDTMADFLRVFQWPRLPAVEEAGGPAPHLRHQPRLHGPW